MRDVVEHQTEPTTGRDPRETLEPMLDDLVRGLGYDKAVVLVYDEPSASLRGLFGWNVTDDQARRLEQFVNGPSVEQLIAQERERSHLYGGRSVFGLEPAPLKRAADAR